MSIKISGSTLCAIASILFSSTQAQAANQWFGSIGYDTGGDTMITAISSGGTETIKANEGLRVAAGALISNDEQGQMATQASLGFKFKRLNYSNADILYTTFPLEILQIFNVGNFRLGGGLTYHINPKISSSGAASGTNVAIKNTLGFIAQAEYRINSQISAGLRYTAINYRAKSGGAGVSGNSVGLIMTAAF